METVGLQPTEEISIARRLSVRRRQLSCRRTESSQPGGYQVNIKFYTVDLKMAVPIDSGAVRFELLPKK